MSATESGCPFEPGAEPSGQRKDRRRDRALKKRGHPTAQAGLHHPRAC